MKVALLLGGASGECAVSLESGKAVYDALIKLGYEVKLINPAMGKDQLKSVDDYFLPVDAKLLSAANYVECVNSGLFDDVDIVFNALHGEWGEDGKIQSLLDFKGIKYTGAGVLASAIAMDKHASKIMFRHFNVPTADWVLYEHGVTKQEHVLQEIKESFGFPCIVKPNNQGSTLGLTLCNSEFDFKQAITKATNYSKKVLIEEFIEGREIEVGIINERWLPLLEIKPKRIIYDYECKYTDGMSEYIVPADIDPKVRKVIELAAVDAYKAVGCESYGRVDFKLKSNGEPYCLEVNTLPGLTTHSLLPKMAYAAGITFEEMIDQIVNNTLK